MHVVLKSVQNEGLNSLKKIFTNIKHQLENYLKPDSTDF